MNQHLSAAKLFEGKVGKPPTPSAPWPGIKSFWTLATTRAGSGWGTQVGFQKATGGTEGRNILHF